MSRLNFSYLWEWGDIIAGFHVVVHFACHISGVYLVLLGGFFCGNMAELEGPNIMGGRA